MRPRGLPNIVVLGFLPSLLRLFLWQGRGVVGVGAIVVGIEGGGGGVIGVVQVGGVPAVIQGGGNLEIQKCIT